MAFSLCLRRRVRRLGSRSPIFAHHGLSGGTRRCFEELLIVFYRFQALSNLPNGFGLALQRRIYS